MIGGIIMIFEHHNLKLDEIDKYLGIAEYAAAKKIVVKHMENELKGKAILNELRGYINEYEKILGELTKQIEELADRNTPNRLFLREQCKGKVKLARSQLAGITDILKESAKDFEE
jgi:hypothetical protein